MNIGLVLHPDQVYGSAALELAQLAEERGFESIWVPETWGRDAFTYLTQLAVATSRIRLGTGITPIFSRSPALIAQTVAALDELSGGRINLGLGTSGPKVVQDWHGQTWDRPLRRTREYLEIIRLALSGQRVNYDGQVFKLRDFALLGVRPVQTRVPIYIACFGPRNTALAGEIADGWLPIFTSARQLPALSQHLAQGAARAGRSLQDVRIAGFVGCAITGDAERDRYLLRRQVTFYVGGMGDYYRRLVSETYGYPEAAEAIRREWTAGRRDLAAQAVPDELLDEVGIRGPASRARERVAEYQAAGVTVLLNPPQGLTPAELAATISAVS